MNHCSAFLKRSPAQAIRLESLRPGNAIFHVGLQFWIDGYADIVTERRLSPDGQSPVELLLTPAVYYKMGGILDRFQSKGFCICALRMLRIQDIEAREIIKRNEIAGVDKLLEEVTSDAVIVVRFIPPAANSEIPPAADNQVEEGCLSLPGASSSAIATFFEGTRLSRTAVFSFCALCIIKPHAVNRFSGQILDALIKADLEISAIEYRTISLGEINEIFEVYKGVISEFAETCGEMASGPCVILQVRQQDVVRKLRELVGPADPAIARKVAPTCLRSRFGIDRARNAIHCTDLEEDGIRDCEYFFK